MKPFELLEQWKEQAALLDDVAGAAQAATFRRCARELAAALEADQNEALTLDQAERESGFNKDSLSRMMKRGAFPNVGEEYKPRIRRGDLPKKPARRKPAARELTATDLLRIVPASKRRRSS